MFVRKKKNTSGRISVQVIDKSHGKYRVLKTVGSSIDLQVVDELFKQGKRWISSHLGEQDIFEQAAKDADEKQVVDFLLTKVENILLNGTQLILDKVFKSIGFDQLNDDILKHLVIARLKSHFDEDVQLHNIYRYLDKLHNSQQEKIQQISVEHTRKILGGKIGLVFYDVTTLYFETDHSDELREPGFSKDGKHSQPQVVLGLLVSLDGYPLS
jgi:hypothetical protein